MPIATQIPLAEYLDTDYRPDREYLDGELLERNMGETPHGRLQGFFVSYVFNRRDEWRVEAIPEQRVQITSSRFRIPDVCLISYDAPDELIIRTPPVLCIEVLSPEDRIHRMQERINDYTRMGVEHIWLIDPLSRKAWTATPDGSLQHVSEAFTVTGTPISISLAEVFAELDDMLIQTNS